MNSSNHGSYRVSGSCDDVTATISFSSGSESLGSVACDGTSFQNDLDLQSLSDGSLTLSLSIEDDFGNVSSQDLSLVKDVIAPAISELVGLNDSKVTSSNQTSYRVSGSCDDASATISFSIGSDSLGSVACDGTSFQNDLDLQSLSDGSLTLSLSIEDSFGNESSQNLSLVKDVVATTLSELAGLNNNKVNFSNQASYRVSGRCDDATATISFEIGSENLGSVVCDGTNFQKDLDLQSLSDGDMTLALNIIDSFGNSGTEELILAKDTVAPTLSSLSGLNNNRVNSSNQGSYRVSGSCDDATATISFEIGSDSLGSVACDGTSFQRDLDLQSFMDGSVTVVLTIEDGFGNESSQELSLTKDIVGPTLSSLSGFNNNKINNLHHGAYRVSGSCDDASATISFSSGSDSLGSVACDGTSFQKDLDLQSLSDGSVTVVLSIEDSVGNESSQNLSLTKDTVSPTLSSLSGLNSNKVNFSNQASYGVSGSCDDATATISFSANSQSLGSVACDGTSFEKDLDLRPIVDGDVSVTLSIADDFGNTSSQDLSLEKETLAPTLSLVSGSHSNKVNISNQSAYTVSGSCDDATAMVSFWIDSESLGSVACDGTNFEKALDLQSIDDGAITLTLKIQDSFENSHSQELSLIKDTVSPTISSFAGSNGNKVNSSNESAYILSGSCDDATAMVSFSVNSQELGHVMCDGAHFQAELSLQPFNDGAIHITLIVEDGVGNSQSQDLALDKDVEAPTLSSLTGSNSNGVNFSNQASYEVSGSCDDATATISFSSGSESLGSVACDGTNFQKDLNLQALSDGSVTVVLSIEDSFGNESSQNLSLTKETVVPSLSAFTGVNDNEVNSSNQASYGVSGSCDDATATVSFLVGSESLGSVACDGTSFTKDLDLQSISDGSVVLILSIQDVIGNTSSQSLTLTKDVAAPTLSSLLGANENVVNSSNQSNYRVSGSCDDATATISFSSGLESLGSVACDGTSFEKDLDLQSFADGHLNLNLRVEDDFGNHSLQSLLLTKDSLGPSILALSGTNNNKVNSSNQASYRISGECDDSTASFSFSQGLQVLSNAVCDGTNFQADLDLSSFEDGLLTVTLSVQDDFGNSDTQEIYLTKDVAAPTLSAFAGLNNNKVNFENQGAYQVSGDCDDAMATISFSSGSQELGTVACDGTSFQKDLDLQSASDGPLMIDLSIEDSSGNRSLQELSLTKDIVAPALLSLSGLNGHKVNIANKASYRISGGCDDATATISFSSGSESLGSVACDGTNFQKDLDLQSLSDGSLVVALSIEDSFGNSGSQDLSLTKDTVAPLLSSLAGSNSNIVNLLSQSAYQVSGSCDDDSATISISSGSDSLGSVACDGTSFQATLDLQPLASGAITLTFNIEDGFGNESSQDLLLNKDIMSPSLFSFSGSNHNKVNLSNQSAYEVSGGCDDATATISFSSGSESLGSVACDGANFQKDLDLQSFSDGDINLTISTQNSAGNSTTQELLLTKDTVTPTISSFLGAHNNKINSSNESAYVVSGSCDDVAATISFSSDSESLGSVACDGTSFEKDLDLQAFADGDVMVILNVQDDFGNTSTQTLSLTKDTVVPTLSSLTGQDSLMVDSMNQASYEVSGSCDDASATISFSSGSESLGSVVCDGANFQKALDLQSFSDGSLALVLSIEDSFGNESSQNLSLTKDVVNPTLSSLSGDNDNKVNFSNQGSYRVSGSCDDNTATISFSSGSQELGTVVCDGTSFEKDLDLQSLSDGSLTLSLSITDSFSNTVSQNLSLTKDTATPTLSGISGENSNIINLENQSAYEVSGSCDEASRSVTLSVDSITETAACDGESFLFVLNFQEPLMPLETLGFSSVHDGAITLTLSLEDDFGNRSSQELSLTKDTVAPTLTSMQGGNENKINAHNQESYHVSGSCDEAEAVITFSHSLETLGTATCDGTSFTKDLDLQSLSDSMVVLTATVTDLSGNSTSQDLSLTKDTVVPTFSSFSGANDNKVNFVNQTAYQISGSCDDATARINFSAGSQSIGIADCDGTSFQAVLDLQSLEDGIRRIHMIIFDQSSNVSLNNILLTKDTVAPSLSEVAGSNNNKVNVSNQAAYNISGNCDADSSQISVLVSDEEFHTTCNGTQFQINLDLQSFSDGDITVTFSLHDSFDNVHLQTLSLTKDTVIPNLSEISGENSNVVTFRNYKSYTVSGSCDAIGSFISLSVQSITAQSVCENSMFAIDLDLSSIPNGEFTLTATISDSHQNSQESSIELSKDTQPFVSVWDIESDKLIVTLPLRENAFYDFEVDWGDGTKSTITSHNDPDKVHTYAESGEYTMTISGVCEIFATFKQDSRYRKQIKSVSNLGNVGWTSFKLMFAWSRKLTSVQGGDTSHVTDMSYMFYEAPLVEPDVSGWDTSNVVNMASIFFKAARARPDVSDWDTSQVTNMSNAFHEMSMGDPDVSGWDTSNVTTMEGMFFKAIRARPDVSSWDTSKVISMSGMFSFSSSLNPDVSNWDTSSVTDMYGMFRHASQATPDVSRWDVSQVKDMEHMFYHATSANPDMSQWTFNKELKKATYMFTASGLSRENYSSLLINLAGQDPGAFLNKHLKVPVSMDGSSEASAARQTLIDHHWTIRDRPLSLYLTTSSRRSCRQCHGKYLHDFRRLHPKWSGGRSSLWI